MGERKTKSTAKEKKRPLIGKLKNISLLDVVEPVLKSGARAHLQVELGGESGHYFFEDGRMVHAVSSAIRGQEAAYHLISWRDGRFAIKKDDEPPLRSVDIEWIDFMRFYEEEIDKIVREFVPEVDGGIFLEIRDQRGAKFFGANYLYGDTAIENMGTLLADSDLETSLEKLRKGDLSSYTSNAGDHFLLVKYLEEVRYCVMAIFADRNRIEHYERWLDRVLEPRALEAVSLALEKADRLRVRGVVLVIDDSTTTRVILKDTLTENRFEAIIAEDGFEGLVKLREHRPQMVFLDVMMPRIDGYEVLKRIRSDPEFKSLPVVMLTSKGLNKDHGEAFESGADLYIEKPFTSKKIITIVENVLGLD